VGEHPILYSSPQFLTVRHGMIGRRQEGGAQFKLAHMGSQLVTGTGHPLPKNDHENRA